MRRTSQYVAMTMDERNAADGCFSTACYFIISPCKTGAQHCFAGIVAT